MGRNEFADLGEEIREAVQSAINKGDFARLKADIGESVNQAFDELKQSFQGTWSDSNVTRKKGTQAGDRRDTGSQREYTDDTGQNAFARDQGRADSQSRQTGYTQNNTDNWANQSGQSGQASRTNQSGQSGQTSRTNQNGYRSQTTQRNAHAASQAAQMRQASRAYSQAAAAGQVNRNQRGMPVEKVSGTVVGGHKTKLPALPVRPVGKVGGILFTVFGSILLGLGVLLLMLFLSIGLVANEESMYFLAMLLGCSTAFSGTVMLGVGRHKAGRLSRMNSYVKLIGNKGYCDLKELAAKSGRSLRYVVKDLGRMIRIGMFPEGHLDDKKTCFMLDNKTHQLYLEMMQARNEAQEVQSEPEEKTEEDVKKEAARAVVAEGHAYIQQIRQANALIPGEEISAKLDRLSMIMDKIFLHIERHPEEVEELHRFMEYYLPTTLKLVKAYQEFDAQPVQGANITTAKQEIEETLDTINQAFERLFDNFYAEAAMDISTDIDVLETMLAQEGLTGHSFGDEKGA